MTNDAGGKFAINATTGVVTVAGPLDYETTQSNIITVKAMDDGGLSTTQNFTISTLNVNEAPIALVDTNVAANTVAENASIGTQVGITAKGTDVEAGNLSYSLTNNAGGKFAINAYNGIVTVAGAVDYETTPSNVITVKVADAGGLSFTQNFTINTTNVNEAPTALADANLAANTVAENAAIGTQVGITAKGTDVDAGTTLTYSLTNNAGGKFAIDAATGVVTVAAPLNYETASSSIITVKVTDNGGLSKTQNFTINTTNVNEAPTALVDTNTAFNNVAENSAIGTVVGITAKASDVDAGTTLTYSLTDNAGGKYAINAATGIVTVAGPLDYEAAHSNVITVKATDSGGLSVSQIFTINTTNVNEGLSAVTDTNALANTVAENSRFGTLVGITASATDIDGDRITYTLSNNDGGLFGINSSTGAIYVAQQGLDFETSDKQSITVVASDGKGMSSTQTFSINVTDVNEAPINIVDSNNANNSVAENIALGSTVGMTAHATDPDKGDTVTYSLSNNAAGRFAIDANTGVVTVLKALDYETASSNLITVKATDHAGASSSQNFTITVTDVVDQVNGTNGNDLLRGGTGADVITGGLGNDNMYGMGGNDIFVFNKGDGNDTIQDFTAGDKLQIHSATSFSNLTFTQNVGSTTIGIMGTTDHITVVGVTSDHFTANDFIFG